MLFFAVFNYELSKQTLLLHIKNANMKNTMLCQEF